MDLQAREQTLEEREGGSRTAGRRHLAGMTAKWLWAVPLAVAAAVFIGTMAAPPRLMDDVDAAQAQIARNMLTSGDWVTPRLNGIVDFEKPPFLYWMIAASYAVFGVNDWAARLPVAVAAVLLCVLVSQIGAWGFGRKTGIIAGVCLATSVGMFIFSRVLFHDVPLTLSMSIAMWAALRALDLDERHPKLWACVGWVCLAAGILIKGLIGFVLPVAAILLYLTLTRTAFQRSTWQRLCPGIGLFILFSIATPWHILAIWSHPQHFDFSLDTEPVRYRGFFWFYFMNEHVLRFLNLRYPRDYTSIPIVPFLLLHVVWLFPWSVYALRLPQLDYSGGDRASRTRLLAACWAGVVVLFFCISTRLEYYTLPAYPALALLLGSAIGSASEDTRRRCSRVVGGVAAVGLAAILGVLLIVRNTATPADLASALDKNPALYTMALGHMQDLTIEAFAYLRLPLVLAAFACLVGLFAVFLSRARHATVAVILMMVVFFHAARVALITFDPHMGSYALAAALRESPPGQLIVDDQYFAFSSVLFYSNRSAKLLNGRVMNLEYGSYAPDAPNVFIDDPEFRRLWLAGERHYLVSTADALNRFQSLVGQERLHVVTARGGKFLLTNLAIMGSTTKAQVDESPVLP